MTDPTRSSSSASTTATASAPRSTAVFNKPGELAILLDPDDVSPGAYVSIVTPPGRLRDQVAAHAERIRELLERELRWLADGAPAATIRSRGTRVEIELAAEAGAWTPALSLAIRAVLGLATGGGKVVDQTLARRATDRREPTATEAITVAAAAIAGDRAEAIRTAERVRNVIRRKQVKGWETFVVERPEP